jgi:lysophospholipase L1-like esterase
MFMSLAILNLVLPTPELALRAADVTYEMGIQFGYPRPSQFQELVPDEDLFWKMRPNSPGVGFMPPVNSLGFYGKEFDVFKSPGVYRLMFLGDSVPAQGYPQTVETFLNWLHPAGMRFESVNLAVGGYSSYQGRILADKYGMTLRPDLVLVSYGWNDHWQAYGQIDSRKTINIDHSRLQRTLSFIYRHSRILQWLLHAESLLRGAEHPIAEVRVPLDEYRNNLTHIGDMFAALNVPVIFITPPTSYYVLGVPEYYIKRGFAASKEKAIQLHRAYNQAVREVAESRHWLVLDLEREIGSRSNLSDIFLTDGIHLTPEGRALLAQRITEFIDENILTTHRAIQ